MKGKLIILSAPSGTGKGTVIGKLLQLRNDVDLSISWTTRAMRPGDEEGVTYFFKTEEEFAQMIAQDGFLEYAGVYGKRCGPASRFVNERLEAGRHVLLEIDTQGALQAMKKCPEAVSVFLLPPSMHELYRRLNGRNTETPEQVKRRFDFAYEELKVAKYYQYCIVNEDADLAARQLSSLIEVQMLQTEYALNHIKMLEEEIVR